MNVLEKILEEIEEYEEKIRPESNLLQVCILKGCSVAKDIICSYMDDVSDIYAGEWIPVDEWLPEVPEGTADEDCPEFNVTIKGADKATTLKYAPDGTWFDDSGEVYKVIAWQSLPEVYKGECENEKI